MKVRNILTYLLYNTKFVMIDCTCRTVDEYLWFLLNSHLQEMSFTHAHFILQFIIKDEVKKIE